MKKKRLFGRQKIVMIVAGIYFFGLAVLTMCSAEIMEKRLPGVKAWYAGERYIEGKLYDTVISEACLRFDTEGTYVWLIVEKNTPLGTRYYVKKQMVEILAQSGQLYGVLSALEPDAPIVCYEERELEDKEQVKYMEDDSFE